MTKGIFVCDAGFDRDHCAASKPIGKSREKTSGFGGLFGCSTDESDVAQSRFVAKEPFHDAGFQIDAIHQVSKHTTSENDVSVKTTTQKLTSPSYLHN